METQKNNGMCRCCASEGTFKDVKSSYQWMGEEEVYAEMLRESLDISLCADVTGEVEGGICEVCITQLRNASNFKKQVLHTEEQFKQRLQDKFFKNEIVKVELAPEHEEESDNDNDNNVSLEDDYSGTEFEVPVKTESLEESKPKKRAKALKASTSRATRAKKLKKEDGESSKRKHSNEGMSKPKGKDILKQEKPEKEVSEKVKLRIEREKHYNNIRQVLACSNATAIRTQSDGFYICCFCDDMYPEPADLKEHNIQQHSGEDIKRATFLRRTNLNNLHVKLDITGLQCNLCNEGFDNLEPLMEHLKVIHERNMFTDINNRMVPFKFQPGAEKELLACFMCFNVFNKLKSLFNHMNTHYRNFICEVCDAGFITKTMAIEHGNTHLTGTFECRFCPDVFPTRLKKTNHERFRHTHGEGLNVCRICDKRFKSYFNKEMHLKEVHGVGADAKCQACDRVFDSQKKLRYHIRVHHLMDKKFKCTVCDMAFYTGLQRDEHSFKHTGIRPYECDICHRAYPRKKSLLRHVKTAHVEADNYSTNLT